MAQKEQNDSTGGTDDVHSSPSSKKGDLTQGSEQENLSTSVDALPLDDSPDSSGVYDRSAQMSAQASQKPPKKKKNVDSANPDQQKKDSDRAASRVAGDTSPSSQPPIPILRTYHNDTRSVAQLKGGSELRVILTAEAEEKRKAQKEYLQQVKHLAKDYSSLQDRSRKFSDSLNEKDVDSENRSIAEIDRQNIDRSIFGALSRAYPQHSEKDEQHVNTESQSTPHTAPPVGNVAPPGGRVASPVDHVAPPANQAVPPTPQHTPEDSSTSDQVDSTPGNKPPASSGLRSSGHQHRTFTEEQQQSLRKKQKKIVEKESIESAWKDFNRKKEMLREKGFDVRDVRSYSTSEEDDRPKAPVRIQDVVAIFFTLSILAGLVFFIISLTREPTETPDTVSHETLEPIPDVINSENQTRVDVSSSLEEWSSITNPSSSGDGSVAKFIPYRVSGEQHLQIDFADFAGVFSMNVPSGLLESLGEYYFVGNYLANSTVHGVFIVSVKHYGNALVWMLNWEKSAINSFSSVFPNFFQTARIVDTTAESRIIDNKDVRIIKNQVSKKPLMYYFFNRSILVFVAGDTDVIPLMNERIRSANSIY